MAPLVGRSCRGGLEDFFESQKSGGAKTVSAQSASACKKPARRFREFPITHNLDNKLLSRLCVIGHYLEEVTHSVSVLLEFRAISFKFRAILVYLHNRTSFSFSLIIEFGPEVF